MILLAAYLYSLPFILIAAFGVYLAFKLKKSDNLKGLLIAYLIYTIIMPWVSEFDDVPVWKIYFG
ncbi:hypothetical protein COE51_01435 [Bacillus pseudomycoides]|nr:hypothetical protein COE51_01435 [Bacillus pseudomycoides]